jgi:predicted enzyme related to lactoylglutathione lyase
VILSLCRASHSCSWRQFGQVPGPLSVFSARTPGAFTRFYMKPGMLDRKLELPAGTAVLIRQRVAGLNVCLFCIDASRWAAINKLGVDPAKLDALGEFRTSPLSYYVGFEAAGQHIGLVPGGGPQGMTSPVAYWHVADIGAKLAELTAAGAMVKDTPRDVGGGRLAATVSDPDGNVLGLIQDREEPPSG